MTQQEWPAEDYAIGSYIQKTVADNFINQLLLHSTDSILDIGCGNGTYSLNLLNKVPSGTVLGIDSSQNMLDLAGKIKLDHANFSTQLDNVEDMSFDNQFDCVSSFWCLQWTSDIVRAFENIYKSLKLGGQVFTLFPSGDDAFITSFYHVRESGEFPQLSSFIPPMKYDQMDNLSDKLSSLPYSQLSVSRLRQQIELPSFDTFAAFVNGIAFYQGQLNDSHRVAVNQAMVDSYVEECHQRFNGKPLFDFSVYLVTAIK